MSFVFVQITTTIAAWKLGLPQNLFFNLLFTQNNYITHPKNLDKLIHYFKNLS